MLRWLQLMTEQLTILPQILKKLNTVVPFERSEFENNKSSFQIDQNNAFIHFLIGKFSFRITLVALHFNVRWYMLPSLAYWWMLPGTLGNAKKSRNFIAWSREWMKVFFVFQWYSCSIFCFFFSIKFFRRISSISVFISSTWICYQYLQRIQKPVKHLRWTFLRK